MKKVASFDLGTTSIGWAFVHEAENNNEKSKIIKTGVRVVPISSEEQQAFKKGQSITTNADRTLKRSIRRNLQRYKLRREKIITLFKEIKFIDNKTFFSEEGKSTTYKTYELRAKAPNEKLTKEELVSVLLMINKKRGYKSNRKINSKEEGSIIDGMTVAKELYQGKLTPGQYSYKLLLDNKTLLPIYYKSDLINEFKKIWNFQSEFYSEILILDHQINIIDLTKKDASQYFEKKLNINRAENKGKSKERKLQLYTWRNAALKSQLALPEIAYILTEIIGEINSSNNYLGAISDRSKALYFNNETVGQYLYRLLKDSPNKSIKNHVFYRQDYINEFNAIWKQQAKHYPELTDEFKRQLKDETIFYQRKLRSQKGLVNICELEGKTKSLVIDGKTKSKLIGPKVAPKSSPIFQEAKIWQNINHLILKNELTNEIITLDDDLRYQLFQELNWRSNFSKSQLINYLKKHSDLSGKHWTTNLEKLEGNRTNAVLLEVYDEILISEGFEVLNNASIDKKLDYLKACLQELKIDTNILTLDYSLTGNDFTKQPAYLLWHLLYSYDDDNSITGVESLIYALQKHFNFNKNQASLLSSILFEKDYGNLSVRALRKIMPFLQDGKTYSEACNMAGYNHSNSISQDENSTRELKDKLEIIKKNSLRNPVVEKILNQMIHVINAIIEHPEMGRPDEVRIELARELKNNAKQRNEMTSAILKAEKLHKLYREKIKNDFGLPYVSRKDLIKYKLYLELKQTGFKTLYSGTYIKPEELFTPKFDIEHIIPQSVIFDDSFSNKTIELRDINLEKGNETAYDYCVRKGWKNTFMNRIEQCYASGKGDLRYSKKTKLLTQAENLDQKFTNRDLQNTAYIAKKAKELLLQVTRNVTVTSGKITARLRSDWGLINILQELNWDKYEKQGLTYYEENKDGKALKRIKNWTKRNDHRHHAMDAIAIAFTKPVYIQYLNNLNAKNDDNKKLNILAIEEKYTQKDKRGKRKFKKPMTDLKHQAKKQLSSILVSHKAKNKVVSLNRNKIKLKQGYHIQTTLTPRGQLHNDTIYGRSLTESISFEKINSSFDQMKINFVTKPAYRNALLKRLQSFDNSPKKAFTGKNSLAKNPIILPNGDILPDQVKLKKLIPQYTVRKEITPKNFSNLKAIEKIIDKGIKELLKKRFNDFNNNAKEAFSNLDNNPIWLNKEKGIAIHSVAILGATNTEAIRTAKDHNGHYIVDQDNKKTPVDFIQTSNNHHLAIYQNEKGELDDDIVSFYDAVIRKNIGEPIIKPLNKNGWPLLFTMKQNEMFVFPSDSFNPKEIDLMDTQNKEIIAPHLYRVQKFSKLKYGNSFVRDYVFRQHLETTLNDDKNLKGIVYHNIKSLGYLKDIVKVRLNHLGEIVQIGEY